MSDGPAPFVYIRLRVFYECIEYIEYFRTGNVHPIKLLAFDTLKKCVEQVVQGAIVMLFNAHSRKIIPILDLFRILS